MDGTELDTSDRRDVRIQRCLRLGCNAGQIAALETRTHEKAQREVSYLEVDTVCVGYHIFGITLEREMAV